jgi:hypothetical protein
MPCNRLIKLLRKIAKSDYRLHHVCPFALIEELTSQWKEFHEIWQLGEFYENLTRKFKFHYNLTRITGTLRVDLRVCLLLITYRRIFLRKINIFDKFVEIIQIHISGSASFPRKSCRLWDNVDKYYTAGQATVDVQCCVENMRFSCWKTKAKNRDTRK